MEIKLADGPLTDKQKQEIARSLRTTEKAPSTRHFSDSYRYYQEQLEQVGTPYDVTRIPIPILQQMERDPMIAFGLHFIRTPIMRARWHIECERADIAAFVDNALRRILPSFIQQYTRSFNYGFSPIVKRFQLENPDWKYKDKDGTEKKVWDNGSVEAITWKNFIPLPPDPNIVEPSFTDSGRFNGIDYNGGRLPVPFQPLAKGTEGDADRQGIHIPVTHALWATNEKETANGSLWGYPRVGYAYRFWWSYWHQRALYDRFFERKSDPPYVVYYPTGGSGDYAQEDENQEPESMRAIALSIGESARSGGVIAMPGDLVRGYDDRPTNTREWEIFELEVKGNMDHFMESFEYLDIMKLRSLWISELSLIEGSGGCLAGDTPIAMPRDHKKYPKGVPLKDVKKGDLVWSYNESTEKFELRPVKNVWLTKKNAEVYKLTLDNGEEIIATGDHPFMSRDGVWRELQELKPKDRLMPLHEKERASYYDGRKAYEDDFEPMICLDPERGKFEVEYREISKQLGLYDPGNINIHHKDGRHCNTSLENLEALTPQEHHNIHFSDPEWKAKHGMKVKEAMKLVPKEKLAHEWTEEEIENLRKSGLDAINNFKARFTDEEWAEFCSVRSKKAWDTRRDNGYVTKYRGEKHHMTSLTQEQVDAMREEYEETGCTKRSLAEKYNVSESCAGRILNGKTWNNPLNHRVVKVEKLDERVDVWDIEIDGPGYCKNYVANGVVVHNTSSRNVANEEIGFHKEGTAVTSDEIDEHINRFVIPDIVAANFPEFNGDVRKVTTGFTEADHQALRDVLQLIGQSDVSALEHVDMREILDILGYPLVSIEEIERREEEAKKAIEDAKPDPIAPTLDSAGVDEQGFYISARERIVLADETEFISSLPNSKHYEDKKIKESAAKLRKTWKNAYSDIYNDFADFLSKLNRADLSLAEDDADKIAQRIVNNWAYSRERIDKLISLSQSEIHRIIRRAAELELENIESDVKWQPSKEEIADWLDERGALLVKSIDDNIRQELKNFLAEEIRKGTTENELANSVREHFSDFPDWKANRLVRTEIRDSYNFATIAAGEKAGVSVVQAIDAQLGEHRSDPECIARNGKFFKIKDALKEVIKEHPNGTIGIKLTNLKSVPKVVNATEDEDTLAFYNDDTNTIILDDSLPYDEKIEYLDQLGDIFEMELRYDGEV